MFTNGIITLIVLLLPKSNFAQVSILGSSADFAMFTSVGEIKNVGMSQVHGNVGTQAGSIIGFMPGQITGTMEVENATTQQAATDLAIAYTYFSTVTCQTVITSTLGGGQVLTPGVYCIGSAIDLVGPLKFDAQGDPAAIFIMQIDGALNVATNASVELLNGASYDNIFWQVNGAVNLGQNSKFKGNIVGNGAINMLDGADFLGRALTKAGAINLTNSDVNAPVAPLAIKLSKFSVVNIGKINKLSWISLSEGDGDFFEIERSYDARNFKKIATTQTKGIQKEYQYLDQFAALGLNYYRLKMKELSGVFTYSQIILANNKQIDELSITAYPNPVKDFLYLKMSTKKGSDNSINIADITGKGIENIKLNENETQVNMTKYNPGIYFVKYNNNGFSQTLKVIKQ